MTIFYPLYDKLYINLTNRCPCRCDFCIRQNGDAILESGSLWFSEEPTMEDIEKDFLAQDLTPYTQIVFCGYGEPTVRLDIMLQTAALIRQHTDLPIRLNTNGLADRIHDTPTAAKLAGLFDEVSISLNASTPKAYDELCHSTFGLEALPAILAYAIDCKRYVKSVTFTVVDCLSKEELQRCQVIADATGVPLRVRAYVEQYE